MMTIAVLAVLGAVAIIAAVVAFVMKKRRNRGRKGQGLGFLSASFRSVLCSLIGNTATPHIATVSNWVCCQFWELPSVKIFLELSQLSFSQVDKEETLLQLQVSVGGQDCPEDVGVKVEMTGDLGIHNSSSREIFWALSCTMI